MKWCWLLWFYQLFELLNNMLLVDRWPCENQTRCPIQIWTWRCTIPIRPPACAGICSRSLSVWRRQRVVWGGALQRSREVCECGGGAGVWVWGGIQRGSVSERRLQQNCARAHTHLSIRRCSDSRIHPQEEVHHFLNIIDVVFMKPLLVYHTTPPPLPFKLYLQNCTSSEGRCHWKRNTCDWHTRARGRAHNLLKLC